MLWAVAEGNVWPHASLIDCRKELSGHCYFICTSSAIASIRHKNNQSCWINRTNFQSPKIKLQINAEPLSISPFNFRAHLSQSKRCSAWSKFPSIDFIAGEKLRIPMCIVISLSLDSSRQFSHFNDKFMSNICISITHKMSACHRGF